MNYQKSWWYPILKKHNIEPRGFNTFDPVFEMGTTNSINDKIVTLKNAIFLIRQDSNSYNIIKSPLAYHNLDKKTIEAEEGTMKSYYTTSKDTVLIATYTFRNLTYQIVGYNLKADSLTMDRASKQKK